MQKRVSLGVGLLAMSLAMSAPGVALRAAAQDDQVKKGQQLYASLKCATCHSIGGQGAKGARASALDGVGTKLSADEIRRWITHPAEMTVKTKSTKKPPMPAKWSSLPAADLEALVAYMQSVK